MKDSVLDSKHIRGAAEKAVPFFVLSQRILVAALLISLLVLSSCSQQKQMSEGKGDSGTADQKGSLKEGLIAKDTPSEPAKSVNTVRANRFLDMAITRFEQLEHLDFNKTSQPFVRQQNIDLLAPSETAQNSCRTAYAGKTILELNEEGIENRAKFGPDHPFALQAALAQAIAFERKDASNRRLLLATASSWWNFSETLTRESKHIGLRLNRNAALSPAYNEKYMSGMSATSQSEIRRWVNDSGDILALLLWAHQERSQAIKTCAALVDLSTRDYPSELAVSRILFVARIFMAENEFLEAHKCLATAQKFASTISSGDGENRLHAVARCKLEESKLGLLERDYGKSASYASAALSDLDHAGDLKSLGADAIRSEVFEQLARALSLAPEKVEQAIDFQTKCLQIRRRRFGESGAVVALSQMDLAKLLIRKARFSSGDSPALKHDRENALERANELLTQVVTICTKYKQANSEVLRQDRNLATILPRAYYELGVLACIHGRFAEARASFERAKSIDFASAEPNMVLSKVADLDALASVYLEEGNKDAAGRMSLDASRLLDEYVAVAFSQLSLPQQIAFSNNLKTHMDVLLAVCKHDGFVKEAYSELVKWKGFLIEQFKARAEVIRHERKGDFPLLLMKHEQVSRSVLKLTQQADGSPAQQQELKQLQEEKESLERQINLSTKEKTKRLAHKRIDSTSVKNALQHDEAFVDFYQFTPRLWSDETEYAAFICSADKLSFLKFGDTTPIDKQITLWRSWEGLNEILPLPAPSDPPAGDAVQNSFSKLEKLLCVPLRNSIPKTCLKLWVCDEGQLSRLPWSVMLSSLTGLPEFELTQVDSAWELLNLKSLKPPSSRTEQLLLVGGIDYSKHNPPAPPLAHATQEIEVIRKEALPFNLKCLVLSENVRSASKAPTHANVLQEMRRSEIVHLVTHGFFRQSEYNEDAGSGAPGEAGGGIDISSEFLSRNPLSDSGLLVSYNGITEDRGFLTAETILDNDLSNCRMITLSACETGRGQEVSTQGVIGLRSALMGAGARTILLSLWPVPDRATSTLMSIYYDRILKGETPLLALRKAQSEVRRHEEWEPPYFWASWIIVGDGWLKK